LGRNLKKKGKGYLWLKRDKAASSVTPQEKTCGNGWQLIRNAKWKGEKDGRSIAK